LRCHLLCYTRENENITCLHLRNFEQLSPTHKSHVKAVFMMRMAAGNATAQERDHSLRRNALGRLGLQLLYRRAAEDIKTEGEAVEMEMEMEMVSGESEGDNTQLARLKVEEKEEAKKEEEVAVKEGEEAKGDVYGSTNDENIDTRQQAQNSNSNSNSSSPVRFIELSESNRRLRVRGREIHLKYH
jgi:hypothetical protein